MPLILGSTSPRRREILNFFSIPFTQEDPQFDESQIVFKSNPEQFVKEVARRKALFLADRHPDKIILTADTIVFLDGRVFLKPQNIKEAHSMLSELSGRQHEVYTGVCVWKKNQIQTEVEKTIVFFNKLTDSQIHTYIQHFHLLDKAGSYAIQKGGSLIVKRVEGCYYNIMGLPIQTVRQLLLRVGIDLWAYLKST